MDATVRDVAAGIHLLTLPYPPLDSVNVYAVAEDDGLTLIDTGPGAPEYLDVVDRGLRRVHPAGADAVRTVYLTHSHTDHVGQAQRLHDRTGARCHLHPDGTAFFHRRQREDANAAYMEWLRLHGLPAERCDAIAATLPPQSSLPETVPYDGHIVVQGRAWEVVPTDGHAPGHVALADRDRGLVFTGDAVLERQVPLVDIQPFRGQDTMHRYLDGLDRLSDLDAALALPAHGQPFTRLGRRIEELQAHHARRIAQVREGCRTRWHTAYELCMQVWGPSRRLTTRLTLSQTIGYLGYLHLEGAVAQRTEDGVLRWCAAPTGERVQRPTTERPE